MDDSHGFHMPRMICLHYWQLATKSTTLLKLRRTIPANSLPRGDWKCETGIIGTIKNAGVENAGLKLSAPYYWGWKMRDWNYWLRRYDDLSVFQNGAISDLLCAYLDHTRWLRGGLCCCAKFGWKRCSSFNNMKVSIFCPFGLKVPIMPKKLGCSINETHKRQVLAQVFVIWVINSENVSTGLTSIGVI